LSELNSMKYYHNTIINLIFTIVVSILCFVLFHKSGILNDAGMAAIFMNWLPLIIGIFTIVVYLLMNLLTKKYSWIVTMVGNLINLVLLVSAFQ